MLLLAMVELEPQEQPLLPMVVVQDMVVFLLMVEVLEVGESL
jgi:hypothetical protein